MNRRRDFYIGATFLALLIALGGMQLVLQKVANAQGQSGSQAPAFQVDPLWPKHLPNHWVTGSVIGVAVDSKDHIWLLHRPATLRGNEKGASLNPPTAECCVPAPPVLEFDQAGNLLRHWGGPGPGYEWPKSEHGLYIDYKDNVWIGANDVKQDAQVLKFTQDGKFLLQIGHQGKSQGSNDTENLRGPANIDVDPTTNEVYVADGYGNHRVIVFDADSGMYKRHWGAYGNRPDDAPQGRYNPNDPPVKQFSTVHCAVVAKDGTVYVCDRLNNRIQVFKKDGTFVKEAFVAQKTLGAGSLWDIDFSKDGSQRFLYVADAVNEKVHILRRDSLQVLRAFGDGGHYPGQFYGVHNLAVDSKGNIYTAETFDGKRVQRFINKGTVRLSSGN